MNYMKNIYLIAGFLLVGATCSFGQTAKVDKAIWKAVIVTRDKADIEGLEKVKQINVQGKVPYAGEKQLRKLAIKNLKKEAALNNITIVLIEEDDFSNSPWNNVKIVGTGYRKQETLN